MLEKNPHTHTWTLTHRESGQVAAGVRSTISSTIALTNVLCARVTAMAVCCRNGMAVRFYPPVLPSLSLHSKCAFRRNDPRWQIKTACWLFLEHVAPSRQAMICMRGRSALDALSWTLVSQAVGNNLIL